MKKFEIEDFPNIGGVMCSKMVVEEGYKPHFIFREKPFDESDSGWRIFSGFESDEYSDNPDNFGVYSPKTILKIDDSISQILLYKGFGSVWERTEENPKWYEVFDYPLEDDFMTEQALTENWVLPINNLFVRYREDEDLVFTTHDKTVRLSIWNYDDRSKEEIFREKEEDIQKRTSKENIIKVYKFDQDSILKIGYYIKEYNEEKDYEYHLLCGFSIVDNEVLMNFFYFDEDRDLEWSLATWKGIEYESQE